MRDNELVKPELASLQRAVIDAVGSCLSLDAIAGGKVEITVKVGQCHHTGGVKTTATVTAIE